MKKFLWPSIFILILTVSQICDGEVFAQSPRHEAAALSSSPAAAGNVPSDAEEQARLVLLNEELSQEAEDLRAKLKSESSSSNIKWFIAGALIFLAGWLLGAAGGGNKRGNPYY